MSPIDQSYRQPWRWHTGTPEPSPAQRHALRERESVKRASESRERPLAVAEAIRVVGRQG